MNTKLAATAVEFVAASSALTDRLLSQVQQYRAREKQASDKRDAVLELMLETGCVAKHQKQAAEEMLADHGQSLDLLVNAINKMQQYKQAAESLSSDLGQPAEKTSGDSHLQQALSSLDDPYVGRKTSQKRASDLAMLAILEEPV